MCVVFHHHAHSNTFLSHALVVFFRDNWSPEVCVIQSINDLNLEIYTCRGNI